MQAGDLIARLAATLDRDAYSAPSLDGYRDSPGCSRARRPPSDTQARSLTIVRRVDHINVGAACQPYDNYESRGPNPRDLVFALRWLDHNQGNF